MDLSGIIAGGSVYGISQRPKIFVRTNDPVAAEVASYASLAADSVELGDLFSTEADAIVSAGNGVGHMNGGVDLRIRDRFSAGRLEERVRQTIVDHYRGELQIGEAFANPNKAARPSNTSRRSRMAYRYPDYEPAADNERKPTERYNLPCNAGRPDKGAVYRSKCDRAHDHGRWRWRRLA